MKKLIAVLLTAAMLFSLVIIIGAEASPVESYASADAGDLLYTVNFNGDDAFSPAPVGNAANNHVYTVGDDGASLTITANTETGADKQLNYWGGIIDGLRADVNTHYTMVYKVKANTTDVKDNSVGIGGLIVGENVASGSFYNNYSNHGGAKPEEDRAAISYANAKINASPNDYVYFTNIDDFSIDADGFVTMMNDFDGTTFTTYILKAGATADLNTDNYIELQSTTMTLNKVKNSMGFMVYCYYQAINTTIKDVKIYKGLNATAEYDPYNTTTAATAAPAPVEKDIRDVIMEAGYGLTVETYTDKVPTIDGFYDEGEWDYRHEDMPGGPDSLLPKGYADGLGAAQAVAYAVEHDENYIYVCGLLSGGRDRGLYISINAVDRGEDHNTPADIQAVYGKGGRLVFGPAVDQVTTAGIDAQVFIGFDGEVKANKTETEENIYYEVAVGVTDDGIYSVHEFKISKQLILDAVNAEYDLGLEKLNYFDLAITLDNYSHFNGWGHIGATAEGAGLDPLADGMTFDDGSAIDRFGMPVYLIDKAPANTPASTTTDPSTPTTAAPTTAAPTTAAPTTADAKTTAAATTAAPAEDEGGCGGSISLAAMAIVPALVCGVAFVGKKKED